MSKTSTSNHHPDDRDLATALQLCVDALRARVASLPRRTEEEVALWKEEQEDEVADWLAWIDHPDAQATIADFEQRAERRRARDARRTALANVVSINSWRQKGRKK